MSQKELDAMADKVLAYNPNKPNGDAPLAVIAGTADTPLVIGETEIPCYVLEDETRVITQRGLFASVGADNRGGGEIPDFFTQKWIKPFVNNELMVVVKSPIPFTPPHGGQAALGYPATILADICMAIIQAHADGATTQRQKGIVDRAILLYGGFGHVGVIALVDEATGYERIREENALAKILEQYIADKPQVWSKTFPLEFYQQICRLRGWDDVRSIKRPKQLGKDTNEVIYERLAPGVLDELRARNPTLSDEGYRKDKHHQWLTPEHGHPKLRERLEGAIAIMRLSRTWEGFKRNLDRVYPKTGAYKPPAKRPKATLEKFFPKN